MHRADIGMEVNLHSPITYCVVRRFSFRTALHQTTKFCCFWLCHSSSVFDRGSTWPSQVSVLTLVT